MGKDPWPKPTDKIELIERLRAVHRWLDAENHQEQGSDVWLAITYLEELVAVAEEAKSWLEERHLMYGRYEAIRIFDFDPDPGPTFELHDKPKRELVYKKLDEVLTDIKEAYDT